MKRKVMMLISFATVAVGCLTAAYFCLNVRAESNECFDAIQLGIDMNEANNLLEKYGFNATGANSAPGVPRRLTYVHPHDPAQITIGFDDNNCVSIKGIETRDAVFQRAWQRITQWVGIREQFVAPMEGRYQMAPMETRYETAAYPKAAFDIVESTPTPVVQPFQGRGE